MKKMFFIEWLNKNGDTMFCGEAMTWTEALKSWQNEKREFARGENYPATTLCLVRECYYDKEKSASYEKVIYEKRR